MIIALAVLSVGMPAQAATYTVSNTNDSGAGSLRQAIIDSNAAGGANTINFTAPSGTIALLTELAVTNTVTFTSTTASAVTITASNLEFSDPIKIDSGGYISIGAGTSMSGLETLSIGHIETGELSISNGGIVEDTTGSIGNLAGSSGTVTVDGAGSVWTNSDVLVVGDNGNGALNITGGGEVENTDGTIGGAATSTATVTVDGVGSTWTNSGDLYVGKNGTGTLDITDGGEVSNTSGNIGGLAGSSGTVNVDGAGSVWTNSSIIAIGVEGIGVLNITGGGVVSNATMGYIGSNTGSVGTVTVDGSGSTWTNTGDLRFGQFGGDGTLNITDGGSVSNQVAHIGYSSGSSGDVNVDGAGSTWINSGILYVGDIGNGTLDITNGGVVSNTSCSIGEQADSIGAVTVDGPGATWTNSSTLLVGNSGDGTLDIRNGGEVSNTNGYIAYEASSVSIVTVDGAGSAWTNSGSLTVGYSGTGTLNITDGGTVSNVLGRISSGIGGGTGTVTVDGAGSTWTNSSELYVGEHNTGTLNIRNGGTVTNTNGIITYDNSDHSTVTVDGAGSTWTNNGTLSVGWAGDATLNITGGGKVTNTIGYLSDGSTGSGTGSDATVDGAGSEWINSEELYVGYDEVATLNIKNGGAVSAGDGTKIIYVSYDNDGAGTINIGDGAGTTAGTINALNVTGDVTGITGVINFNHDNSSAYTFSTPILDNLSVEQKGPGTTILSGTNTYTGGTTITAGTLTAGSTSAFGAGDVDNNSGGTLDVAAINLGITGTYTQNSGSTLKVTVDAPATSGRITTGVAATINSGSSVYMNIGTGVYVPTVSSFTIIDTGGAGISDVPGTVTSNNRRLRFTPQDSGGNLVVSTSRASIYFADLAANSNQFAIGTVLDGINNPTGDMATVLAAMECLSASQAASSMNSMLPDYSGASIQVSQHTLDQLTEAVLSHQAYLRNSPTGVSTGSDMFKGVDVWAEGYGSYLHQGKRQLSQGYNASIWGTAIGFDIPSLTDLRVGACFGFAQGYVRGKDSTNRNNINSYQWTVYSEYAKDAYYIDFLGAFALNTYDASRKIYVSPVIARTASADYNGQQYQIYIEGGYAFNHKDLTITPIASFQYEHLYLDKYTETGADSLSLTVKSQNYDLAQTGLGIKLDYPLNTKYGKLVPELKFKWLYDWIGDAQEVSSTLAGGGGAFATNGFTPAQSAWDFGTKLTMFTNNSWTLEASYDFELKENFYGHYGSANAKYSY